MTTGPVTVLSAIPLVSPMLQVKVVHRCRVWCGYNGLFFHSGRTHSRNIVSFNTNEIIAMASDAANAPIAITRQFGNKITYGDSTGVRAILLLCAVFDAGPFCYTQVSTPQQNVTIYGFGLPIIGMCIFNIGLTYGLVTGSLNWRCFASCLHGITNQ